MSLWGTLVLNRALTRKGGEFSGTTLVLMFITKTRERVIYFKTQNSASSVAAKEKIAYHRGGI